MRLVATLVALIAALGLLRGASCERLSEAKIQAVSSDWQQHLQLAAANAEAHAEQRVAYVAEGMLQTLASFRDSTSVNVWTHSEAMLALRAVVQASCCPFLFHLYT